MPMTSYTGGGLGERSPSGGSSTVPLTSLRLRSASCWEQREADSEIESGDVQ